MMIRTVHRRILAIVFIIMLACVFGYQLNVGRYALRGPIRSTLTTRSSQLHFVNSQRYNNANQLNKFNFHIFSTSSTPEVKKDKKSGKKGGSNETPSELTPQGIEELRQTRLLKIEKMREQGINPFAYTYPITHTTASLQELYKGLGNGEENDTVVSVAGRIMARRLFGKLAFFEIKDDTGSMQLYLDKGRLNEDFDRIKDWTDAGDIIGATGTLKRTEKGELSIYATNWSMLTKSLQPLPDKYHGLTDTNKRYRQRHLDMIVNEDVRKTLRSRALIISSIRKILDAKGFIEIETPILNNQPGGAEAKPFETYHNSLDMHLTLRIATELHLKRLVVGGINRVYEIGRIFRNEGISTRHNPEFTSIELYQAYGDYSDMMNLTEELVSKTALEVVGKTTVPYQGKEINLSPPWRRITMIDIVKEKTGIDFTSFIENKDYEGAKSAIEAANILDKSLLQPAKSAGELLNILFEEKCEETLDQPTFITDYPVEASLK